MRHMKPMFGLTAWFFLATSMFLVGCSFFPEASFELASQSRLPKWFVLPPGLSRTDVTVTMDYYAKASERTATFIMRDKKKQKIAQADGTLQGEKSHNLKNPTAGFPSGYPSFEIVTVNGVTEVIEHRRMEPFFYITDDPAVLTELGIKGAGLTIK